MSDNTGKSNSAIIGAIVIIIILIGGGFYLSRQESRAPTESMTIESVDDLETTDTVEAETQAELEGLSASTDVSDIEADLDIATDISELEADLQALEAELDADSSQE